MKKKRIDIDIIDKENEAAIIIENKIYHHLNNDLDKYYNHYKSFKNKIIVLLTLEKFGFTNEKATSRSLKQANKYREKQQLVAITHKEWVDAIKEIKLPTGLKQEEYVYLNDFFNTIENLTKNLTMTEDEKFYFNHTEQVNKAASVKLAAKKHIMQQIMMFTKNYNSFLSPKSEYWFNIFKQNKNIQPFYSVSYRGLFKDRSIKINITVISKWMKTIDESDDIKKQIENINLDNQLRIKSSFTKQYNRFIHLFEKEYEQLSDDNISKLSEFLNESIINDFKPIMLQLDKILTDETTVVNSDWFPKKTNTPLS